MAKKSLVKSCLICDVARKELGGKDILIGVYSGSMVVPSFPVTIPSFAVWIEVTPPKKRQLSIEIKVISPEGNPIVGGKGEIEFGDTNDSVGLPFQFPSVTFPVGGRYRIEFGYDGVMETIGEFRVRMKEDSAPLK